jgi:DNA-binding MarR family transcriptional regulator
MTGLIDSLLKDGLVKKYQDTEDRRQVWVELTPKAEAFLKEIMPSHFKRIAKFMSAITREEGEQLIRISRKLHGALGAFTEDDDPPSTK